MPLTIHSFTGGSDLSPHPLSVILQQHGLPEVISVGCGATLHSSAPYVTRHVILSMLPSQVAGLDALALRAAVSGSRDKPTLYVPEALVDTLWDNRLKSSIGNAPVFGRHQRTYLDTYFNVVGMTETSPVMYMNRGDSRGAEVCVIRAPCFAGWHVFGAVVRAPNKEPLAYVFPAGVLDAQYIRTLLEAGGHARLVVMCKETTDAVLPYTPVDAVLSLPYTFRRRVAVAGIADTKTQSRLEVAGVTVLGDGNERIA